MDHDTQKAESQVFSSSFCTSRRLNCLNQKGYRCHLTVVTDFFMSCGLGMEQPVNSQEMSSICFNRLSKCGIQHVLFPELVVFFDECAQISCDSELWRFSQTMKLNMEQKHNTLFFLGDDYSKSKQIKKGELETTCDISHDGSMYGIYVNIWDILMVNVTIYSLHGSYGYVHLSQSNMVGLRSSQRRNSSVDEYIHPKWE